MVLEGTEAALRVESVAARRARRHLQMHLTRIQQRNDGDGTMCWYAADTPILTELASSVANIISLAGTTRVSGVRWRWRSTQRNPEATLHMS